MLFGMPTYSFPKKKRILRRSQFVNLNRSGKRRYTKHFTLICKHNGLGITRLGVTVSKRIGGAVRRNRIKRLLREFFRLNQAKFPPGYDIVITAKKDASFLNLQEIERELREIVFDRQAEV